MSRASTRCLAGFPHLFVAFMLFSGVAASCDNHYPVAPLPGDTSCDDLVQTCAVPAAALGGSYQTCYETGMSGDPDACLEVKDHCVNACESANVEPPNGQAGAAGSNSGASGEGGAAGEASALASGAGGS